MFLACFDLEGVLVPEVWVNVAERTGIPELRYTTRDIADYDELMQHRLRTLDEHGIKLSLIQEVIGDLGPLPGAVEFFDWVKRHFQVMILSDTFYEFGMPMMAHLGYPTLFCHNLEIKDDRIVDYHLRLDDQKTKSVKAFQSVNMRCIATGDSYNDIGMLTQADAGILFSPPDNVVEEFPQFPVTRDYDQLARAFEQARDRLSA